MFILKEKTVYYFEIMYYTQIIQLIPFIFIIVLTDIATNWLFKIIAIKVRCETFSIALCDSICGNISKLKKTSSNFSCQKQGFVYSIQMKLN